jgi:hypothetical protein
MPFEVKEAGFLKPPGPDGFCWAQSGHGDAAFEIVSGPGPVVKEHGNFRILEQVGVLSRVLFGGEVDSLQVSRGGERHEALVRSAELTSGQHPQPLAVEQTTDDLSAVQKVSRFHCLIFDESG